jgi:hypothetical protein
MLSCLFCVLFLIWYLEFTISLVGLELLIRANLSTAGALRYYDKMIRNVGAALKAFIEQHRSSSEKKYASMTVFLWRHEQENRKYYIAEYLSSRRSPTGIQSQSFSSMLLDYRCDTNGF